MTRPKPPPPKMQKDTGTRTARTVNVPPTVAGDDPYTSKPNTRKTRGQFRTIEFIRAIEQHGYFIVWRKGVICPCVRTDTQQTNINCTHCDGSGYFYFDPIKIRGIMSRFDRSAKPFEKFGRWVEGSASLTVEPQYRLHYFDQIEMLDSVMSHSEIITRGNRRGMRSRLPGNTDVARYRILRMTAALVYDDEVDEIFALEEGSHFKITPNGWIEWLVDTDVIPDETPISVVYEYHPIYVVTSHPHALREGVIETKNPTMEVVALPIQTDVQLDYLALAENTAPLPSLMKPAADGRDAQRPRILGAKGC